MEGRTRYFQRRTSLNSIGNSSRSSNGSSSDDSEEERQLQRRKRCPRTDNDNVYRKLALNNNYYSPTNRKTYSRDHKLFVNCRVDLSQFPSPISPSPSPILSSSSPISPSSSSISPSSSPLSPPCRSLYPLPISPISLPSSPELEPLTSSPISSYNDLQVVDRDIKDEKLSSLSDMCVDVSPSVRHREMCYKPWYHPPSHTLSEINHSLTAPHTHTSYSEQKQGLSASLTGGLSRYDKPDSRLQIVMKESRHPITCQYDGCGSIISKQSQMLSHLKQVHIDVQVDKKDYRCHWRGCKQFMVFCKNAKWLESHCVRYHCGKWPFQCMKRKCRQPFRYQATLEKHYHTHFIKRERSKKRRERRKNKREVKRQLRLCYLREARQYELPHTNTPHNLYRIHSFGVQPHLIDLISSQILHELHN